MTKPTEPTEPTKLPIRQRAERKSEIYIAPHSSKPSKPPIPIYQVTEMSMCSYYETISSNHIKDIPTSGYGLGCR